jgi:hypothetical protein
MNSDWFQKQTIEHLKEIRATRTPGMPEYQMADDAIRQKEAEQAREEAARLERVESQRHQEAIALDQQAISQSRFANRLALLAIGIAGAAFVVAILAWLFPREPQASGHREAGSLSEEPSLQSPRPSSPSLQPTNAPQPKP